MVFRGRPSKAPHRCRSRRLKCDLRRGSCTPCIRANIDCHGYRDAQELRILDESLSVQRKALVRTKAYVERIPHSLTVPVEAQARDIFFAHYVMVASRGWDFLTPYFDHPTQSPVYLKLSIDAVSLAFLAHQRASSSLLALARHRYASALSTLNEALRCPLVATQDTTLTGSLVLDLFEKITHSGPVSVQFWRSHIDGSLALIQMLGLSHFRDHRSLRLLSRFITNFIICCVASETTVPTPILLLRAHLARHSNVAGDPKWEFMGLIIQYTSFHDGVRNSTRSLHDSLAMAQDLDQKLLHLSQDMPPQWRPEPRILRHPIPNVYDRRMDFYPDRHTKQTWNVLRLVRILLNEFMIESSQGLENGVGDRAILEIGLQNIANLNYEICASVPQYADHPCNSSYRQGANLEAHVHSPSHLLDCYTLIYPLYIAGRSRWTPWDQKQWILQTLHHIGNHFDIPNASKVARLLEKGHDMGPWAAYAMLGGYGFVP